MLSNYLSFSRLKRVTSWIFRFIRNCRSTNMTGTILSGDIGYPYHRVIASSKK